MKVYQVIWNNGERFNSRIAVGQAEYERELASAPSNYTVHAVYVRDYSQSPSPAILIAGAKCEHAFTGGANTFAEYTCSKCGYTI